MGLDSNRYQIIGHGFCGLWWVGYQQTRDGARRLKKCIMEKGEVWWLPTAKIWDRKRREFIT